MEVTQTEKGKNGLNCKTIRSKTGKVFNKTILWRCSTKSCNARTKTDKIMRVVLSETEHNHPPLNDAEIEKMKIRVTIVRNGPWWNQQKDLYKSSHQKPKDQYILTIKT